METRSATLDGALSNLGDTWDNLFLTIANSGVGGIIETNVRMATTSLADLSAWIENNTVLIGQMADVFGNAAKGIAFPFEAVGGAVGALSAQLVAVMNGDFKEAMAIGNAYVEDMGNSLDKMTDPEIAGRYEIMARKMVAANEEIKASAPGATGKKGGGDNVDAGARQAAQEEMTMIMAQATADQIEVMADYYTELGSMAEQARMTEEELEQQKYDKQLEKIEKDREFKLANDLLDAENQAEIDKAKEDAEIIHQEKMLQIRARANKINAKAEIEAAKFKKLVDKGQYGDAFNMMADFAAKSGALNEKQFEAVKKIQMGIAVVKGIGTVMNAIEHGSENGGVYGAVIEGAIAAAMVVAQLTKLSSANSGSSSAGGGVSGGGGGSMPQDAQATPVPVTREKEGGDEGKGGFSITLVGDPNLVDDGTLAKMGEKLAPIIQENFDNGTQNAVRA